MIRQDFKEDIETFSARMIQENPLFVKAKKGALSKAQVQVYLNNLHHVFSHTTRHLALAENHARHKQLPVLAEFFHAKIPEEQGHEQWAVNDIRNLTSLPEPLTNDSIRPATHNLINFISEIIQSHPVDYVSYMYCVEYFTVLVGPQLIQLLEKNCGISREHMTAIGNHVQADAEHTEEDLGVIEQLAGDPEYALRMKNALLGSMKHVDEFLAQAAGTDR